MQIVLKANPGDRGQGRGGSPSYRLGTLPSVAPSQGCQARWFAQPPHARHPSRVRGMESCTTWTADCSSWDENLIGLRVCDGWRPVTGDALRGAKGKVWMRRLLQACWVAATLHTCLVIANFIFKTASEMRVIVALVCFYLFLSVFICFNLCYIYKLLSVFITIEYFWTL